MKIACNFAIGLGSFADEAILAGFLDRYGRDWVVLSADPVETARLHNVLSMPWEEPPLGPTPIPDVKEIAICGGGVGYGQMIPVFNNLVSQYPAAQFHIHAIGLYSDIVGQGFETLLKHASTFTVRDLWSQQVAQEHLNITPPIEEDFALSWARCHPSPWRGNYTILVTRNTPLGLDLAQLLGTDFHTLGLPGVIHKDGGSDDRKPLFNTNYITPSDFRTWANILLSAKQVISMRKHSALLPSLHNIPVLGIDHPNDNSLRPIADRINILYTNQPNWKTLLREWVKLT